MKVVELNNSPAQSAIWHFSKLILKPELGVVGYFHMPCLSVQPFSPGAVVHKVKFLQDGKDRQAMRELAIPKSPAKLPILPLLLFT